MPPMHPRRIRRHRQHECQRESRPSRSVVRADGSTRHRVHQPESPHVQRATVLGERSSDSMPLHGSTEPPAIRSCRAQAPAATTARRSRWTLRTVHDLGEHLHVAVRRGERIACTASHGASHHSHWHSSDHHRRLMRHRMRGGAPWHTHNGLWPTPSVAQTPSRRDWCLNR